MKDAIAEVINYIDEELKNGYASRSFVYEVRKMLQKILDSEASGKDAVEFAEWIDGNDYTCDLHTDDNIKLWDRYCSGEFLTTENLYKKFKQSTTSAHSSNEAGNKNSSI